jgi:hypothetical protein
MPRNSMSFSVRRTAVHLIALLLEKLLTIVRTDTEPPLAHRRQEERVDVKSCRYALAVDRGPDRSIHPPKNDSCILLRVADGLGSLICKESARILIDSITAAQLLHSVFVEDFSEPCPPVSVGRRALTM